MMAASGGVVVIEDNALHARWLARCVEQIDGLGPCVHASSAPGARTLLQEWTGRAPAVLLLDLALGDAHGLDLMPSIRASWPETVVIVVSQHEDDRKVVDALSHGARGYLIKDGEDWRAIEAIRGALQGLITLSPRIASRLIELASDATASSADRPDPPTTPPPAAARASVLTPREKEVLECFVHGMSYDDAALELGISKSTVETHIRHAYRKLQVNSKTSAVLRASMLGLIGGTC